MSTIVNLKFESSNKKKEKILISAKEVFLDHGYISASMDNIAKKAQVSKQTIYSHYRSKKELFFKVFENACEKLIPVSFEEKYSSISDLEKFLISFSKDYLKIILNHNNIRVFRAITSESVRFPELGRMLYYSVYYGKSIEIVENHLIKHIESGYIKQCLAKKAAEQFVSMIKGEEFFKYLLGMQSHIREENMHDKISETVRDFLKIYRV